MYCKTALPANEKLTGVTAKSLPAEKDVLSRAIIASSPPVPTSLLQAADDSSVSLMSKLVRSDLRQSQKKAGVDSIGVDGGDLNRPRRSSLDDLKVTEHFLFYLMVAEEYHQAT